MNAQRFALLALLMLPALLDAQPVANRTQPPALGPPAELVLPMFIREGATDAVDISSMPGVQQHSLDSFRRALVDAASRDAPPFSLDYVRLNIQARRPAG